MVSSGYHSALPRGGHRFNPCLGNYDLACCKVKPKNKLMAKYNKFFDLRSLNYQVSH